MDNKKARLMLKLVRKYDDIAISFALMAAYLCVVTAFDNFHNIDERMFSTPDAKSYKYVADWLLGLEPTRNVSGAIKTRPFLYPAFIALGQFFLGHDGIWFWQFLMWTLSGVFLFRTIKRVTNNVVLSLCGVFVFASNLSFLLITQYALTEGLTGFLLIVLANIVSHEEKYRNGHRWLLGIFIVSLLTVTKPVYQILLFVVLVYGICVLSLKVRKGKLKIRVLGYIFVALCPIWVQLSIIKVTHNRFAMSDIVKSTVNHYFFPTVYGQVNNLSGREARKEKKYKELLKTSGRGDMRKIHEYLLVHYRASLQAFFKNIKENVKARPYLRVSNSHAHFFQQYMQNLNSIYYYLHIFMLLPFSIVVFRLCKKRKWKVLETIGCLALPVFIIIFTSGITFGQGDRIVLSILPLWIVLYSLLLAILGKWISEHISATQVRNL